MTKEILSENEIEEFNDYLNQYCKKTGLMSQIKHMRDNYEKTDYCTRKSYDILKDILNTPEVITKENLIMLLTTIAATRSISERPYKMYHKYKYIWNNKGGCDIWVDKNETWQNPEDERELFGKIIRYLDSL